ncbi:MAG: hypothetical protein GC186_15660 [Rhodobacteraceae bacterium]|nr:hypothetical protein [Paracoccaceae bacterium]
MTLASQSSHPLARIAAVVIAATVLANAVAVRADVVYLPCKSVDDCGPVQIPTCPGCNPPDNGHPIGG